tara:strand:- start:4549 stop:5595 length:1047 start_codon:yes stop_codon:yes gene_type:complete
MNTFNISTVHDFFDTRIQAHLASSENAFFIGFAGDKVSNKIYRNLGEISFSNRVLALFRIIKILKEFNDGDIVIFHDPELILAAGIAKFRNNKLRIVFDAHENILEDVKHKTWVNPIVRWVAQKYFHLLMKTVFPRIDGVLTVTPSLVKYYKNFASNVIFLPNFPFSKVESNFRIHSKARRLKHCYIGSISRQRGAIKICEIAESLEYPLLLIGSITDKELRREMEEHKGWENIDYTGYIPNKELQNRVSDCEVGLLLLDDIDTFYNSYPVKIFDYVNNGLIVVWTGRSGCEYENLVNSFPNLHLSENFNGLTFDKYLNHFFSIDQRIKNENFIWGNYYKEFIKCVEY